MEFLKGYKFKLLGLVWSGLAALDGFAGVDILRTVDASNAVEMIMLGFAVFAGRDTLDTILDKLKGEIVAR